MAKGEKKPEATVEPFNNPFSGLAGRLGPLPPGREPSPPPGPASSRAPLRAVVHYERKGHGGKEATRVEKLGLSASDLERWLRELKQSLGCGGFVDGDALVLQGDQRERLPPLLEKRGVRCSPVR